MNKPIKITKRPSVKSQIESIPNLDMEMQWYKRGGKNIRASALKRGEFFVFPDMPLDDETLSLHTHYIKKGKQKGCALPSPKDFDVLFRHFISGDKIRTVAIASLDKNNISGYTFFRIPKEGIKVILGGVFDFSKDRRNIEEIRPVIKELLKKGKKWDALRVFVRHALKEKKVDEVKLYIYLYHLAKKAGAKIRFKPMLGYAFDVKQYCFVKQNN